MNIVFLSRLNRYLEKELEHLREKHPQVSFFTDYHHTEDEDHKKSLLQKADAVVAGRITEEQLEQAPNLKVIFVPFVGINPLPLDAIRERGIIVSNAHGNAEVTAEKALALAMATLGRIVFFHNDLAQGYWHRSFNTEDLWESMYEKNFGIMGMGHIGTALARHLKPYNTRITGYRRNTDQPIPEPFDEQVQDPETLVEKSDVIFVCLPLTRYTRHLIDEKLLRKMEERYLINIGRGDIIDEAPFYQVLKEGVLKGAGIDVWYNYPTKDKPEPVFPSQYPFHELENVVLSPHKASHATTAIKGNARKTAENIGSFIEKGEPASLVDFEGRY